MARSVLRRGGAFFIRRSFSGDRLYGAVVAPALLIHPHRGISLGELTSVWDSLTQVLQLSLLRISERG